jgi:large subunit ribosomal protein L21
MVELAGFGVVHWLTVVAIPSYNRYMGEDLSTYAIVRTGGKQYRVSPGDTIRVESLPAEEGDTIELDDVLMLSTEDGLALGTPRVSGAKVTAEVVGKGKGKKIVIFKYKAKTRYRRRNGHRQLYTDLKVTGISS